MLHSLSDVHIRQPAPVGLSRLPLVVAWVASCAAGCTTPVEIGEAKADRSPDVRSATGEPEPTPSATSSVSAGPTSTPEPEPTAALEPEPMQMPAANPEPEPETSEPGAEALDCTAADAKQREAYDNWSALGNELDELSGKTFSGYVEGGPDLTLTITAYLGATLVVGVPTLAAEADEAYLCSDAPRIGGRSCRASYDSPPVEGAAYSIHGATFKAGRLIAPIQLNAPYDAWCALQTPHELEPCFYQIVGSDGFSRALDGSACTLGGEVVDCGLLEMLVDVDPCHCTSRDCFAAVYPEAGATIDARFDAATGELSGSFIDGERARLAIHLFEVTD